MSDIKHRLRRYAEDCPPTALEIEAANEIERLEARLAGARLNWKLCEDQLLALREGLAEAIAILSTFHGEDDVDAFLAKHKEQA